jgi:hypothetical protein
MARPLRYQRPIRLPDPRAVAKSAVHAGSMAYGQNEIRDVVPEQKIAVDMNHFPAHALLGGEIHDEVRC